jgi:2-polyprenyl-3-methyl-5-hydroxy-6-metoxy-1,4-benzoquinol methylase/ketosteroid isomerase-like protein
MEAGTGTVPIEAAFNAISRMDADALVALCDPNVNFESRLTALDDVSYRGHVGVRRYIANLAAAFDRIEVHLSDLLERPGVAVMTNRVRAQGRGSGVVVELDYFCAARGENGRLVWWGFFDSREHALAAVGLGEHAPRYALGHSDRELERLQVQARLIEPITRRFFFEAGLAPGMRVLDLGSGVGDVAFLAAQLVGPTGEVVGVDRSPEALAVARQRAQDAGLANVSFEQAEADGIDFERSFDALLGRYVLMFQPNPVATLRNAANHVRSGGLVVFHEPEWACMRSEPPVASWDRCCEWVVAAMTAKGADMQMGMKLARTFAAAGIGIPTLRHESVIGAGSASADQVHFTADIALTLLPDIERLNLTGAGEIDPDTFADELLADVAATDSIIVGRSEIGAWART